MSTQMAKKETAVLILGACLLSLPPLWRFWRRCRSLSQKTSSCCSHPDLANHSKIFKKQIIAVKEDVLVAIGYGIANCICIKGKTGLIIIDTCESNGVAEDCLRDFRKFPGYANLPIEGIILTHFHYDHVSGTGFFLKEAISNCEIWGHHTTGDKMVHFGTVMGPIAWVRGARQFGFYLSKPILENCGIGPFLRTSIDGHIAEQVVPNRTYGDSVSDSVSGCKGSRQTISLSGVELELIHAPGETEDQTVIFMPSHRILFAADNYYEAFPNLYAIRGVPYRDPMKWAHSLDTMRALDADIMVPSHTCPVYGKEEVSTRLRNYRDAIAYVHDQTVRLALKGEHPDLIASSIHLPKALRSLEYLKEFYGTVQWSVKSIFTGYLGWFSGEPSELFMLKPSERAVHMVELGGGAENCLHVVQKSQQAGQLQWALELTTALLEVPELTPITRERATNFRIKALQQLGERQISATGRNYYMVSAFEARRGHDLKLPKEDLRHQLRTAPMEDLFSMLPYRIDAEAADGQNRSLRVSFADTDQSFLLVLCNSVMTVASSKQEEEALLQNLGEEWLKRAVSVEVSCPESAWRKMLASPISLGTSWLSGHFVFTKGSLAEFSAFMACLDNSI